MEKILICPQTIYKFNSGKVLLEHTINEVSRLDWQENLNNYRSVNVSLHKAGKFAKLHEWFEECLSSVKEEVQFACEKLTVTQSWANLTKTGQWHHKHIHQNSIVSGIYYLNDSNSYTLFGLDNIWNYEKSTGGMIKLNYDDYETLSIIHKHKPVKGDLILFPSTLFHAVEQNTSHEERYSISFNSFANGKLGNDQFLSVLNLEIT
jgi:uncharacterized protein (TIGR02466 family)